jgi:hypothetical protein
MIQPFTEILDPIEYENKRVQSLLRLTAMEDRGELQSFAASSTERYSSHF